MAAPEVLIESRKSDNGSPPPVRRGRLRFFMKIVGVLMIAGLIWAAWAFGSFYQFRRSLQTADPATLESRIDWTSVLSGLREDLRQEAIQAGLSGSDPAAATQTRRAIEALVTRQGVINLLRAATVDAQGWPTARAELTEKDVFGWGRIRSAFFFGGPFTYRVDISADSDKISTPMVLVFKWLGDWRLTRVYLPADAEMKTALRAPRTPDVAAVLLKPPSGAQRAVLFEDDTVGSQGIRYPGWVVWSTEETPNPSTGRPDRAVIARVTIPGRPLTMTMTIRRNLDELLPATHVVEVRFELPPGQAQSGIADVFGIMMKPSDAIAGDQLAGSRAKISDQFFLIGLSAAAPVAQRNLDALVKQPWFGIPFVYNNKNRAVLAIEKGPIGEKNIAQALKPR